jgi:hypothetical protein
LPGAEVSELEFCSVIALFRFSDLQRVHKSYYKQLSGQVSEVLDSSQDSDYSEDGQNKAETVQLVSQIAEFSTVDVARRLFIDLLSLES